jgi:hypothetical protein
MRLRFATRVLAVAVLATMLVPSVLCFGAITSSPHQCCMRHDAAVQENGGHGDCCVISAPAPNPAAVVTSSDSGIDATVPAMIALPNLSAMSQPMHASASSDHSPPGMSSKTNLRI